MLSFAMKELGSMGRYVRAEFRVPGKSRLSLCAFSLLTLLLPAVHLHSFSTSPPHPPRNLVNVFFLVVSACVCACKRGKQAKTGAPERVLKALKTLHILISLLDWLSSCRAASQGNAGDCFTCPGVSGGQKLWA